jgi:hypothetical protein
LFRGELLKGFDIASEIWCDWLDSERRRLHDLAAIVLFGISKLYSKTGAMPQRSAQRVGSSLSSLIARWGTAN